MNPQSCPNLDQSEPQECPNLNQLEPHECANLGQLEPQQGPDLDQLEQHEHPGLEISLKELKTNGLEDKDPKDDKQVNSASLRITKMNQRPLAEGQYL